MLRRIGCQLLKGIGKNISTTGSVNKKVAVLGAAHSSIGPSYSLLVKQLPHITELAIFDITDLRSVSMSLSQIENNVKVTTHFGIAKLNDAIKDADVIAITAAVPFRYQKSPDGLFFANACIVHFLVSAIAKITPKALIALMTTNTNCMVPIAAEVLKKAGVYDPRRLFGVTSLNTLRTQSIVGEIIGVNPKKINIPVVGGCTVDTMIPLFSKSEPTLTLTDCDLQKITLSIRKSAKAALTGEKRDRGSYLSLAYANTVFTCSLLKGLNGDTGVKEYAYVDSESMITKYFVCPFTLGTEGIEKTEQFEGTISSFERSLLKTAVPVIRNSIKKGEQFAEII